MSTKQCVPDWHLLQAVHFQQHGRAEGQALQGHHHQRQGDDESPEYQDGRHEGWSLSLRGF